MLSSKPCCCCFAMLCRLGAGRAAAGELKAVLCRAAWDRASAKPSLSTPDHPALPTRLPTAPPPLPACTCSLVPQVMLARWLDYRGQASRQTLLWGFLNARFQTGLRNLLDGAILQTGAHAMFLPAGMDLHSIACMPHPGAWVAHPPGASGPKLQLASGPKLQVGMPLCL